MSAAQREILYAQVDAEIARLKTVFTPPTEEPATATIVPLTPTSSETVTPARAEVPPASEWSGTLVNIQRMSQALKQTTEKLAAAEERAKRAEARATEAEQWLRRLHQAVQTGMQGMQPAER